MRKNLENHTTSKLSDLDMRMVRSVPSGGNWQAIPLDIPSKRLEQIRKSGGRSTYYGRLWYDRISYTISTFFNRPGNGCYIHPDDGRDGRRPQHRLITFREAARLQSFPDEFVFKGTKGSKLKQIGNAVPPLLARAIACSLPGKTYVDLFCGAGGMSLGFEMAGKELMAAIEIEPYICETFRNNFPDAQNKLIEGDIGSENIQKALFLKVKKNLKGRRLDVVVGGPPCQGFSLAGNRLIDDPRNTLFKHFVHVVKKLRPKVFLMENVPGLLSMDGGKVMREIMSYFSELNYDLNSPVVLHAEDYGVPQKRRRLFLLGCSKGINFDFPPKPLFSADNGCPRFTTVRDALSDLPAIYEGLGEEKVEFAWTPRTKYQELMGGQTDFNRYYKSLTQE